MNTTCQALAVVLNHQLDQEILQLIKDNKALRADYVREICKPMDNGTFCNYCREESDELVRCTVCLYVVCSDCSTRCCSNQYMPRYGHYDDSGHHVCTRCQSICSECGRGRRTHCLHSCRSPRHAAPVLLCKESDGGLSDCESRHARECAYYAEFELYGYN